MGTIGKGVSEGGAINPKSIFIKFLGLEKSY